MSTIYRQKSHNYGKEAACKIAEELADNLAGKYDLSCHWDENHLHFSRMGANGVIIVDDEHVEVQVKLSFLLMAIAPAVESEIDEYLNSHF